MTDINTALGIEPSANGYSGCSTSNNDDSTPSWFSFKGRARRREIWENAFFIISIGVAVSLFAIRGICNVQDPTGVSQLILSCGLCLLMGLIGNLLMMPVTVRRFHDRGMSGWNYLTMTLLSWIPGVNIISSIVFFILLFCLDGTPGRNEYGPDPKGRRSSADEDLILASLAAEPLSAGLSEEKLQCQDGTPGPNEHGPDPKGRSCADEDLIPVSLAAVPLFVGLSEEKLRELCAELGAHVRCYGRGEIVTCESFPASVAYVVLSGRIVVCEGARCDDVRRLVCILYPGESYGMLFPVTGLKNNPYRVTAEEPSELLLLRVDRIREWILKGTHPKFVANLYKAAARQGARA